MILNGIVVAVLYPHLLNPALNYCNHHKNVMGHELNIAILRPGIFRWFLIGKQALLKSKQANQQRNPTSEFSSGLAILCFPKGPALNMEFSVGSGLTPATGQGNKFTCCPQKCQGFLLPLAPVEL